MHVLHIGRCPLAVVNPHNNLAMHDPLWNRVEPVRLDDVCDPGSKFEELLRIHNRGTFRCIGSKDSRCPKFLTRHYFRVCNHGEEQQVSE